MPALRGMHGHACTHVKDLLEKFKPEDFADGGIVDFVLGGEPHTGAFVMGYDDHPIKKKYMSYFKFGEGPLYMFYTPYHLPHMQLPHSVARAVLFNDPTLTPLGAPVCDTVSIAKRDLKAGERLDGMGGFTCYGLVDRYATAGATMPCRSRCRWTACSSATSPRTTRSATATSSCPPAACATLRAEQTAHFATSLRKVA